MSRFFTFASFKGVQRLAPAFQPVSSNQMTSTRRVTGDGDHAAASRAVAATTYIASVKDPPGNHRQGASAELAAVVPSAAPSALFFFKTGCR